jgi:acetyl-CoA acetyltransferase
VRVLATAGAASHEEICQMPDDPMAAALDVADRLYHAAGRGPADVDLACLYDSFTVTVALQVLAYGLDGGRGLHALVGTTGTGPGGGLPINTHGGLLSGTTSGIFHLVEAVRQLRGEAGGRQVDGARIALVTNVGGAFSNHFATIHERDGDG